jgi:hypothetical protein
VDVVGGPPRELEGTGDAAQPSWSPSGDRIAYWSNTGGQRDVYTVPSAGGARVAVVEDGALDWSPVWGPAGRSVYFGSDRGGSMNLWSVAVDPASGRPSGVPEPITTGVPAALEQPSISKDGRRLVFRSRISAVNPVAVPFDPVRERAGTPVILNNANVILVPSDVSPDGRSLVYYSQGDRQEDLFLSATDGSGLRRITDDAARDRGPVWTPDGKTLVFYSNRGGRWEIWRVDRDGGNLQRITGLADENTIYPLLSPSGDRLVFTALRGAQVLLGSLRQSPPTFQALPTADLGRGTFVPTSWSADSAKLAGSVLAPSGRPIGFAVYDLTTGAGRRVSGDAGDGVRWLSDSKRLMYFTHAGQLVLVNTVTSRRTVIDVRLPLDPVDDLFAVSKDDRTIFYGGERAQSDIWIIERGER